MDARFLLLLYLMRLYAGVPFRISSDHRPPEHNQAVGGAEQSAHQEEPCACVDLKVMNNRERFRITRTAYAFGVHRIGVARYETDPKTGAGIVHIDCSRTLPPDVCW